jgi:hypothetical protein
MANDPKLEEDELVSRLLPDPAQGPPDTTPLRGYLGRAPAPSAKGKEPLWRLYTGPALDEYAEIPESEIQHTQKLPDEQGSIVWVPKTLPLKYVRVQSSQVQAELLGSGSIAQQLPTSSVSQIPGPGGGDPSLATVCTQITCPSVRFCLSRIPCPSVPCPSITGPCLSHTPSECTVCPTPSATPSHCTFCPTPVSTAPSHCTQCPPPQLLSAAASHCTHCPPPSAYPSVCFICPTPTAMPSHLLACATPTTVLPSHLTVCPTQTFVCPVKPPTVLPVCPVEGPRTGEPEE